MPPRDLPIWSMFGVPDRFLYIGYFMLTEFATFMRFMLFPKNLIAGCDSASPWPPHFEHIWGVKLLPVCGLFYVNRICIFYEIYAIFQEPHSRM